MADLANGLDYMKNQSCTKESTDGVIKNNAAETWTRKEEKAKSLLIETKCKSEIRHKIEPVDLHRSKPSLLPLMHVHCFQR